MNLSRQSVLMWLMLLDQVFDRIGKQRSGRGDHVNKCNFDAVGN